MNIVWNSPNSAFIVVNHFGKQLRRNRSIFTGNSINRNTKLKSVVSGEKMSYSGNGLPLIYYYRVRIFYITGQTVTTFLIQVICTETNWLEIKINFYVPQLNSHLSFPKYFFLSIQFTTHYNEKKKLGFQSLTYLFFRHMKRHINTVVINTSTKIFYTFSLDSIKWLT